VFLHDVAGKSRLGYARPQSVYNDWITLSGDARYSAMVDNKELFYVDWTTGARTKIANVSDRQSWLRMSRDGSVVAWITVDGLDLRDTNAAEDIYVYDNKTKSIERVSFTTDETQLIASTDVGHPSLSKDGRYVAWTGSNRFFAGAFLYDRKERDTQAVDRYPDGSVIGDPLNIVDMDDSARFFVMHGHQGIQDFMLVDRVTNATIRLPLVTRADVPDTAPYAEGSLSGNARVFAFPTRATNMPVENPQDREVLYLQDLMTHQLVPASVDVGSTPTKHATDVVLSQDGHTAAWLAWTNGVTNVATRSFGSSSTPSAYAVLNYYSHYQLKRYGNIGRLSGTFTVVNSDSKVMRLDGSGTMSSSYGGTDTLKVHLRRLLDGDYEGYVSLTGTKACSFSGTPQLSEYHECTPDVYVDTSESNVKITSKRVSSTEAAFFVTYPNVNGTDRHEGFSFSVKSTAPKQYDDAGDKVVLQSHYDPYLHCASSTVDSHPKPAWDKSVQLIMTKTSGSGVPKVGDKVTLKCVSNNKYVTRVGTVVELRDSVSNASKFTLVADNQDNGTEIKLGTTIVRLLADDGSHVKDKNAGSVRALTGLGDGAKWTFQVPAIKDPTL
jgi:hypothetical protein